MHEIFHFLGLCGEKHLSILSILLEVQNWDVIFKFIKFKFIK
jgi:hypothetical protein